MTGPVIDAIGDLAGIAERRAELAAAAERNAAIGAALRDAFPASERTVPRMLSRQAERYGSRTLLICGEQSWSFAEVAEQVPRWAAMLQSAGIAAGDRVALICGNRFEFMPLLLGCAWLGAVAVTINTASRGFQLQHILRNSGARLLCIEASLLAVLDTIDLSVLAVERIFVIGEASSDGADNKPGIEALPAPSLPVLPMAVGPGDTLAVLYTSGTTGLSKGVCCPHAQYFWWGLYTGRQIGVCEGDVLHTTLPLFHTNALNAFFQALLYGATLVVAERFSVSRFWEALEASRATITYVLGAMVPMLLSRPPSLSERSHRVRAALAPGVPADFHAPFVERTGVVLLDGYGATESNAVIGTDALTSRPGWMGCVVDGFEARVVDDNDAPVADGEPGELLLRAHEPFAFAIGYFAMPEQTCAAWRNLWLHTGDRVVRSPDGYFRFVDRMKDSIRRRGENISSFEVEQVLLSHPAIAMAAVFPVRSELAEDEVMAVLVRKDGAEVSEEQLIRHCERRMPYFSVPRYIEFAGELPKTENGKIQKFRLRERGRSDTTWDREVAGVVVRR
ncbi:ATP-dependent acyl-CoA ligase [Bradyrhizobium jicamae]|uniref:ATP-dependent acyl-CoA ligase n=1 Tax=Bradyrhizobium jicamae TaxID=280332 RepID=UPI001BA9121C|nr:ATP-dependent acyl-CoA ligase [Bradyrhizobium jicamae]MBR0751283.1 ATP-dependent acyl-CoA ligase [Bradyrhizobium jicamae]